MVQPPRGRDDDSDHNKDLEFSSHASQSDENDDTVATKEFQVDLQAGSQQVDGMRRSIQRQATALHVCFCFC